MLNSKYVIPNFDYIHNYDSVGFLPNSIKNSPSFSKFNYYFNIFFINKKLIKLIINFQKIW